MGVFVDLSKAFDAVDREVLPKRLELHGIKGNNNTWWTFLYQTENDILNRLHIKNQFGPNEEWCSWGNNVYAPPIFLV